MVVKNRLRVEKSESDYGLSKMAYSRDEVAKLWGVSTGHIINLIKRGDLRAIRAGRRILIMDEDLRRYIEEHVVETGA